MKGLIISNNTTYPVSVYKHRSGERVLDIYPLLNDLNEDEGRRYVSKEPGGQYI